MRYSAEQLDRWATWLDTEESYAVTKFETAVQMRYFRIGVSRGDFSWMSSAVGYINRASLRSQGGAPIPGAELRVVQELGKAAHNHIACAAVGRLAATHGNSLIAAYLDVQDEWRRALNTRDVVPLALGPRAVATQLEAFRNLQEAQDTGSPEVFEGQVLRMSLPVHTAFIHAAETYGWPQPGLSSTADAVPWKVTP
jgi:hypothetical protein